MTDEATTVDDGSGKDPSLDWVQIKHNVTGGEHVCLREAYEETWREKGWELVGDVDPVSGAAPGTPRNAESVAEGPRGSRSTERAETKKE